MCEEGAPWKNWRFNRKVKIKTSQQNSAGGGPRKGLFAGVPFNEGEVITIYGGQLLTAKEAESVDSEYLLRISGDYLVDGAPVADRLTEYDPENDLFLPKPDDPMPEGPGALANAAPQSSLICNAKLDLYNLRLTGIKENDETLPRLPMLVATRAIAEDEEVLFDYGKERVPQSKVHRWLSANEPVLRMGELIDKLDAGAVRALLENMLDRRENSLQVAFLQGATPLQRPELFDLLGRLLREAPKLWSLNLGEIELSAEQCEALTDWLRESKVTHMFYECTRAGEGVKKGFMDVIRKNRSKLSLWRFTDDDKAQNAVIFQAEKSWFTSWRHKENQEWVRRSKDAKMVEALKAAQEREAGTASEAPPAAAEAAAAAGVAEGAPIFRSMAAAADEAPMAAYRGLSAAADEAEEPRYNACGASSYRGLAAEAEEEEASSLLSFERDLPGPPLEASGSVIDSDDELTIWLRMMMLAR